MSTDQGQMNAHSLFRSLRPRPAPVAAQGSTESVASATVAMAAEKLASAQPARPAPQPFEVLAIGPWPILRDVSLTAAPVPPALSEEDKIRRRGSQRSALACTPPASPLALPDVGAQLAQGLAKTREHWLSERFAQLKRQQGPARPSLRLQPTPSEPSAPGAALPAAAAVNTARAAAPLPVPNPVQRPASRSPLFRAQPAPAAEASPARFDAQLSLAPGLPAQTSRGATAGKDLSSVFSRLAAARQKPAQAKPAPRLPLDLDPR